VYNTKSFVWMGEWIWMSGFEGEKVRLFGLKGK